MAEILETAVSQQNVFFNEQYNLNSHSKRKKTLINCTFLTSWSESCSLKDKTENQLILASSAGLCMLITLQMYTFSMMWLITVLNNIKKCQNLENKSCVTTKLVL